MPVRELTAVCVQTTSSNNNVVIKEIPSVTRIRLKDETVDQGTCDTTPGTDKGQSLVKKI